MPGAIAAAKKAVEEDPELMEAHEEFARLIRTDLYARIKDIDKMRAESIKTLSAQYDEWAKRFPNSAGVQCGHGMIFGEDPGGRPFLLKAVALNPKLAKAYSELSMDAELRGDLRGARDYMGKAAEVEPSSPDYAFYYAGFFEYFDAADYTKRNLEVVQRFPTSERGAQALYWLGERAVSDEDKIHYWEMDRAQFSPRKFDWSADAMGELFDVYARTSPDKALALAQEMKAVPADKRQTQQWDDDLVLAQNLISIQKLFDSQQFAEAKTLLDGSKVSRYSSDASMLELLKAKATAGAGGTKAAYDALLARYAKTPEDPVHEAILKYGSDLGKAASQVESDVWALRDAAAKPAPDFNLDQYLVKGKKSLADYRGKVVLLTFWFPGCGPCRGEFPHFENVLRKFRGQDVSYVGINAILSQDDYVRPFIKGTRYSFTPLRGGPDMEKAYKVQGEPTNFLIDKAGRIVYTDFRASDPKSERVLQLMIQSLLDH